MSTISSVSSTPNPYPTADQNGFGQTIKNFRAIGNALQSGNLTAAQTALSAFQQNLPGNSQTSASSPFGNNSQANTDYQSLVGALQSGSLSGAQQAFTSLQTDLNAGQASTRATRRGHHHHHGSGDWSAQSSADGSTTDSTPTSTTGTSTSWPTPWTNGTSTSAPTASTSGTSTSGPTASANGITATFTAEIEIVQIGITLNATA